MISVTLANKLLKYIIGFSEELGTSSKMCYLGFSTQDPGSDGSNFTEPDASTYPSYGRIQLHINLEGASAYTNKWGTVADKQVALAEEIVSSECLEDGGWPTFTHFGIFNHKTTNSTATLLAWDLLTDPDGEPDEDGQYPAKTLTVGKNEVAVFREGALKLMFK